LSIGLPGPKNQFQPEITTRLPVLLRSKKITMKQKHFFLPLLFLLIVSCNKSDTGTTPTGLPAPPASLGLSSFYKKYTDAGGGHKFGCRR